MSHKTNEKWQQQKTKWVEKPSSAVVSMNNILAFGRKLGAETERRRILQAINDSKMETIEQVIDFILATEAPEGVKQMLEEESNES
jgi:geranylgeranyl pyrophosphate synthase